MPREGRSDRPIVFFYPFATPPTQPFDLYIAFIDQQGDVCRLDWESLQLSYSYNDEDIQDFTEWLKRGYREGRFPVHCTDTGLAIMIPRVCLPPGIHHVRAEIATEGDNDEDRNVGEGEITYCIASGSPTLVPTINYHPGNEADTFSLKVSDPAGLDNASTFKAWLRRDAMSAAQPGLWEDITEEYCKTSFTVSAGTELPRCCNKEGCYASMPIVRHPLLGSLTNEFCFCYINSLGLQARPVYLCFDKPPPQGMRVGLRMCPQSRSFTPQDSIEPFARVQFTPPNDEEYSLRVKFELTWWAGGAVSHWNPDESMEFSSNDFEDAIDIYSEVFKADSGMPPGRYRLVAELSTKNPGQQDFGAPVATDYAVYIVEAQGNEEPEQIEITVDLCDRAQQMVGFGGFIGPDIEDFDQNVMERVCELIFSDLGSTILRIGTPMHGVLRTELFDNSRSFELIKCAFRWGAEQLIVVTCSPPAQWKNTGNMCNLGPDGSWLEEEHFENFINWVADFICEVKAETGHEVDVWSVQNEPDVLCGYPGALYYHPDKRDVCADLSEVVRIARPILRFRGLLTQVAISDGGSVAVSLDFCSTHFPEILHDEDIKSQLGVITAHQYNAYGRNRFVGDDEKGDWEGLRRECAESQKTLWQTELSVELNEKPAGIWTALINAEYLHIALACGDCSAWLYFNLYWTKDFTSSPVSVVEGAGVCVNKVYFALKHYFRYVRPGMFRLGVTSDDDSSKDVFDTDLLVSTFASLDLRCLTLVVINRSTNQYHLKVEWLNLVGVTALAHLMTTEVRNCERVGTVHTDDEYLLICPKSINTFTNVALE